MKTVKFTSEIPLDLYNTIIHQAQDAGVDKDTLIQDVLKQYFETNHEDAIYNWDYQVPPAYDLDFITGQGEWITPKTAQ